MLSNSYIWYWKLHLVYLHLVLPQLTLRAPEMRVTPRTFLRPCSEISCAEHRMEILNLCLDRCWCKYIVYEKVFRSHEEKLFKICGSQTNRYTSKCFATKILKWKLVMKFNKGKLVLVFWKAQYSRHDQHVEFVSS